MKARFALPLFLVILAVACQNPMAPLGPKPESTRQLTIHWKSSSVAMTILPASYPAVATYDVVLSANGQTNVTQSGIPAETASWLFQNLAPVVWNVTVTGSDANSKVIAQGTSTVDMTTVATQNTSVVLNYISTGTGTGGIDLTLDLSAAPQTVTAVTLTLTSPSGQTTTPTVNLVESTATFSMPTAAVGNWTVFFKITAGALVAQKMESVLVVQNVTTTGTITVASNDFPIALTGVGLSASTLALELDYSGGAQPLSVIFSPGNATNQSVTWTSDNPAVATVNQNGLVSPAGAGTTNVRVTTADGAFVATCAVTVTPISLTLVAGGGPGIDPANGNYNGTGSQAGFIGLEGISSDASGNLFGVDRTWPAGTGFALREITSAGVVTSPAGSLASWGSFQVMDSLGNLYGIVNTNTIVKMTPAGTQSTLVANSFLNNGNPDSFGNLAYLAIDTLGNIYATDNKNNGVNYGLVRKVTPAGVVTTLAGGGNGVSTGILNGTGTGATFGFLAGISVDASGNVFVADAGNSLIRKITPAGVVTTLAGSGAAGGANGAGPSASFNGPGPLVVDAAGNVFVGDHFNGLRKISPSGVVSTVVQYGATTAGDGSTASVYFAGPDYMTVDPSGNLYADMDGATVWKVQY